MSKRRKTSVQMSIESKEKQNNNKRKIGIQETIKPKEKHRRKSKKITAEGIGVKIGKGIAAIRKADIAIQEWADSPGLIPPKTEKKLKKGKSVVGRSYRGYKRAQKAEDEYTERLDKGTKAHGKRVARMNKLVRMLGK